MKTISLEIPDGKEAKWVDGVLTLVDVKDNRPVTERIKTFEDACRELGEEHTFVQMFRDIYDKSEVAGANTNKDVVAYLKLRIITAALNEGWEPEFTKGEYRWYAWYDFFTKEEYDNMTDAEKANCRVVGRAVHNAGAVGGLVYSNAFFVSSHSHTGYGSRLAFKSEELAEYAAKQFIDIYADYCFVQEKVGQRGE